MRVKTIQAAVFGLTILLLAHFNYRILVSFLEPLTWAAILVVFSWPVHKYLRNRLERNILVSLLSVLVVTAVLVIPLSLVAVATVKEASQLSRSLSQSEIAPRLQRMTDWISARLPVEAPDVEQRLGEVASTAAAAVAKWSARSAGGFVDWVFAVGIFLLALFYLFRDGQTVIKYISEVTPLDRGTTDKLVFGISSMVTSTIQSNVIVAASQGACTTFTFWVLSLPGAVFWGVAAGVLAFLPLVGPAMVWIPAALILFVQGNIGKGVAMLLLGAFLISGVDNFLRPWLLAGRAELNGLLAILSIFGGIQAFGFLGLVLGPVIMAFTIGALKGYRQELADAHAIADSRVSGSV